MGVLVQGVPGGIKASIDSFSDPSEITGFLVYAKFLLDPVLIEEYLHITVKETVKHVVAMTLLWDCHYSLLFWITVHIRVTDHRHVVLIPNYHIVNKWCGEKDRFKTDLGDERVHPTRRSKIQTLPCSPWDQSDPHNGVSALIRIEVATKCHRGVIVSA